MKISSIVRSIRSTTAQCSPIAPVIVIVKDRLMAVRVRCPMSMSGDEDMKGGRRPLSQMIAMKADAFSWI
jgi:hypothetical protein